LVAQSSRAVDHNSNDGKENDQPEDVAESRIRGGRPEWPEEKRSEHRRGHCTKDGEQDVVAEFGKDARPANF
jgi:hypothetical protein